MNSQATASGQGNKFPFAEQISKNKLPNKEPTEEKAIPMTPQQRAQLEMHIRQHGTQGHDSSSMTSAEDAWNNLPEEVKMLYNEIVKALPLDEPVAVDLEQKATMSQQLRDLTVHLGRMDTLVQFLPNAFPGQEDTVRTLILLARLDSLFSRNITWLMIFI